MSTTADPAAALDAARNNGSGQMLPAPSKPLHCAREFAGAKYTHETGITTLRHWRGGAWEWHGSHWAEVERSAVESLAYLFTEHANYIVNDQIKSWSPNQRKIGDLLKALAAITHLGGHVQMPSWLDGRELAAPIVACTNGLVDVATRKLQPHSPLFYNAISVPFDYDPHAPEPGRWIALMGDLWPEDPLSILTLQEWFGYVLSGRTDLHKILNLVGPTRGGKGVITRTLRQLVGEGNYVGPRMNSLGKEFGLAPLIGKSLAVFADIRLTGGSGAVEQLLTISGEDALTIPRKHRDDWDGTLPTRLMICTNELPQLKDTSAAIAGRIIVLQMTESWLGREDRGLEPALRPELPGILNWSLDGLERLCKQGEFTRSEASLEAGERLRDLSSPVAQFVAERCIVEPGRSVLRVDIWNAWTRWAWSEGVDPGTANQLGTDLRTVAPKMGESQPWAGGGERPRLYTGIGLAA